MELMEQVKEKKNVKKLLRRIFGWITFGSGIFLSLVILVNSCLPSSTSGLISSFFFVNIEDALNPGKSAPTEPVTGADLVFATKNSYKWNYVNGYQEDEIPLGCTKKLVFNIAPSTATNKNYSYKLIGATSSQVAVTRDGTNLYIQPNELVNFSIECTTADGSFTKTKDFKTVELVAPQGFLADESIKLVMGKSKQISLSYDDVFLTKDGKQETLMPERYYDVSKLTFTPMDNNIISVNEYGYITSKQVGSTTITVSNGELTKTINVEVKANEDTIVEPTSFEIAADKLNIGLLDMDNDRSPAEGEVYHAHIVVDWWENVPTDDSIYYISSDPLTAMVDSEGNVRGYRKSGEVTITAYSVRNPELHKSLTFVSSPVMMTDFDIKNKGTSLEAIAKGQNRDISFTVSPSKATNIAFECKSDNESILVATSKGRTVNLSGVTPGKTTFKVWPKDNPDLVKTYEIEVRPYSVQDDPNYNEEHSSFRKSWGHFAAFLIDGVLLTVGLVLLFGEVKYLQYFLYIISLTFGVSLAGLTEFIQKLMPTRNGNMNDVLIDSGGYFIGVLSVLAIFMVIALVKFFVKRKKKK